jgi:hypothetical protein
MKEGNSGKFMSLRRCKPIQEGIRQHEELRALVKEITRINVRLMRARTGGLELTPRKGKRHE